MDTYCGLLAILIWSTSGAVTRSISEQMGALTGGCVCGILSGLFGIALSAARGEIGLLRHAPRSFYFGCVPLYLTYRLCALLSIAMSATRQQVVQTGLLRDLWPVSTMLIFLVLYRQKCGWKFGGCIVLSCLGAGIANVDLPALITGRGAGSEGTMVPCGLALLSSLAWGLYSALMKKARSGTSGSGICMLLSGAVSGILLLFFPEPAPTVTLRSTAALIYAALITVFLATVLWNRSMQRGNQMLVICLSNYIPIITALLSALLLRTALSGQMIAGTGLIAIGTLLGQSGASSKDIFEQ